MSREEFITKLVEELRRLYEEENVNDLIQERDAVALANIEMDYSFLEEYEENSSLAVDDIPEEYLGVLAIYLNRAGYDEFDLFEYQQDFRDALQECGEVEADMAEVIQDFYLSQISLEELLAIIPVSNEE